MEFHGIRWRPIWRLYNSMEYHGIFHGIPWKSAFLIPWNYQIMKLLSPLNFSIADIWFGHAWFPYEQWDETYNPMKHWFHLEWRSPTSLEFYGTWWYMIWRFQSSVEFHDIFNGNPLNPGVIWNGALLLPWNSMELGDIWFGKLTVSWNTLEYSMNSMESPVIWYDATLVPWNFIEHCNIWYSDSIDPWTSIAITKFRGIPWNLVTSDLVIQEFHGIHLTFRGCPRKHDVNENGVLKVSWNSMELGDILFGATRVPWNFFIEYSMEFRVTPSSL